MTPITIEPNFKVVEELNIPTRVVELDELTAKFLGKTEMEGPEYGGPIGLYTKPEHEPGLGGWHTGTAGYAAAYIVFNKDKQCVKIVFDEMFHKGFHNLIDQLEATSFDVFFDGETVLVKPL